ncbi:Hypothetical protein R9X50_00567500 [Acrodontium crateriforme]|uniref:WAC domain-containing protein n=1 Tax=Acrodontium crateriforme TaxID=150365 RepID=A0AAQ3MCT6_9PEZI|nr:Hypothetical protein R9X50_00567500 [Acrodontium crateriforme]
MVLFKRKPIHLIPQPTQLPDNAEVFVMRGTGEIFTDYEKYLKRHDYLNQKKFTDAVNGKSNLTYFEAMASETKSSLAIENAFPAVLRDPILRRVQFSQTSRMDELVNEVYELFKRDFFPGEEVIVLMDDGEQYPGAVREKAKFPQIQGPDGSIQRAAFTRYFVRILENREEEAIVDDGHIRRDKKVFTKQNLRGFLKNSLQREGWIGAPWLVKEHLAIQYRLPMEIPQHLLQDAKMMANKVLLNLPTFEFNSANGFQQQTSVQAKPQKGHRKSKNAGELQNGQQVSQQKLISQDTQLTLHHQHSGAQQPLASREQKPAAPVIKYPIEDLDIEPKCNGVSRPKLQFFTEEMAKYVKDRRSKFEYIDMDSMGLLLEVWNTLNVHCEVYVLDSFTFDDFVDAMGYKALNPSCELLNEAHCAVLKQLVDTDGKLLVKGGLPEIVEDEEDDEEDGSWAEDVVDSSEVSTPQNDFNMTGRKRSRLSHVDPAVVNPRSPSGVAVEKVHRAAEMLSERSWKDRLAAREFEDGGWQVILVGFLYQISFSPIFKTRCDKVLAELAPLDAEPTQETALFQYSNMDINLRISALQMLTMISLGSEKIREFLEQCAEDMTDVRKKKIEHQRERKVLIEEHAVKERERKIMWPDNMPKSPEPEIVEPASMIEEGDETMEAHGGGSSDPDDDAPPGRALRRGNDRKRKRDEEAAKREKERIVKAEAVKAQTKQTKEFKKILHDLDELSKKITECEREIADCDSDLREANVQRTRMLGQDRFCNRYYWYERNGQPFGGLPTSSTREYGYANARIWVQGPDKHEIDAFIGDAEQQKEYQSKFRMTLQERRKQEEGPTILDNANEWGYYDDPDRLDNLIGWLDERGVREKRLRKELIDWRDTIVKYMGIYKDFMDRETARKVEAEEEQEMRITTRHKTAEDQTAGKQRVLRWTNSTMMEEEGRLHSMKAKPKEKRQPAQRKGVAMAVRKNNKR